MHYAIITIIHLGKLVFLGTLETLFSFFKDVKKTNQGITMLITA